VAAQTLEQGLGDRIAVASFFVFAYRPGVIEIESVRDAVQEEALACLLAQIAGRDARALASFYDATLSKVYGLILRVVRNPADAEEVVGDLYLQVWDQAGAFDPARGSALAWLRTLAWSRATDRSRRYRRHAMDVALHPEDDSAAYAHAECEELAPEALASAWSSARAVQRAFAVLSDVQRRILTLAYQQDMSQQDIAHATGLPLGTVKSHARRGLALLREALGGEDSDHV
jgi:RNA polymerase sigma-70 factor, ECF subfamily